MVYAFLLRFCRRFETCLIFGRTLLRSVFQTMRRSILEKFRSEKVGKSVLQKWIQSEARKIKSTDQRTDGPDLLTNRPSGEWPASWNDVLSQIYLHEAVCQQFAWFRSSTALLAVSCWFLSLNNWFCWYSTKVKLFNSIKGVNKFFIFRTEWRLKSGLWS